MKRAGSHTRGLMSMSVAWCVTQCEGGFHSVSALCRCRCGTTPPAVERNDCINCLSVSPCGTKSNYNNSSCRPRACLAVVPEVRWLGPQNACTTSCSCRLISAIKWCDPSPLRHDMAAAAAAISWTTDRAARDYDRPLPVLPPSVVQQRLAAAAADQCQPLSSPAIGSGSQLQCAPYTILLASLTTPGLCLVSSDCRSHTIQARSATTSAITAASALSYLC